MVSDSYLATLLERRDTVQNVTLAGPDLLGQGTPISCLIKSEQEADAVIPVGLLRNIVPSPQATENPRLAAADSRLREAQLLRAEVQRAFTGAKQKNVRPYSAYINGGLRGDWPLSLPAIHVWHPAQLSYVEYPPGQKSIVWPHGDIGVCIDGETQRAAWEAVLDVHANPAAVKHLVSVTFHHGKPLATVREIFYLYNVMEVKPTASIAISMDTRDPATQITRALIDGSGLLHERVSMTGRSAKGADITNLGGLRTAIVTTIRGRAGLQIGTRRVDLGEDEDEVAIRTAVLDIWHAILEEFKPEFDSARERGLVIAAPSILAGIGAIAHHAMPMPPRDPSYDPWPLDRVISTLRSVNWKAKVEGTHGISYPWDGVAGRVNSSGSFSVSGPKEVGHQVAFALANPESEAGRKIRTGIS